MRILSKLSVCAAAMLVAGCGGKVVRPHYYTLETPPALSTAVSVRQVAATVSVSQFGAPPYLRQGRIVYRQSPEEIGFYEYRRWAAGSRRNHHRGNDQLTALKADVLIREAKRRPQ